MSQTIFWGNIYCGNVGAPTMPPLHCTFGHTLYRVANPLVQGQWEHVCLECGQPCTDPECSEGERVVVPWEHFSPELTDEERSAGVVGKIVALPITFASVT